MHPRSVLFSAFSINQGGTAISARPCSRGGFSFWAVLAEYRTEIDRKDVFSAVLRKSELFCKRRIYLKWKN